MQANRVGDREFDFMLSKTNDFIIWILVATVAGVMKLGNTVPRVGLEPTSLAFSASVLPLHHVGFPDVTTIPKPTCVCSSLPSEVSADYYTHPPGIVSLVMFAITYIQAMALLIQGRFNNHTACSLYRIHGRGNQCLGCDENGKYCS